MVTRRISATFMVRSIVRLLGMKASLGTRRAHTLSLWVRFIVRISPEGRSRVRFIVLNSRGGDQMFAPTPFCVGDFGMGTAGRAPHVLGQSALPCKPAQQASP